MGLRRVTPARVPLAFALCALVPLHGCGTLPAQFAGNGAPAAAAFGSRPVASTDVALVATDLVSALMQTRELSPWSTTVQLGPTRGAFGAALLEAFRDGGYGVQRVSVDQGQRFVAHESEHVESEAGAAIRYALAVGGLRVERDYRLVDGKLFPASVLRFEGATPTRLIVNDDVYRQRGGETVFPSGVVFLGADGEELERREREVRVTAESARAAGERVGTERFLVQARAALFLGDRLDGPDGALDERELVPIKQLVLRFPEPGSLELGAANKRALARLRRYFDASGDRFSLTGCSHGRSLLWDGTESDSLARSQRVKEELMLAGVPSSRVREEGCFATRYADRLPPQAVIVTLERRARSEPAADAAGMTTTLTDVMWGGEV